MTTRNYINGEFPMPIHFTFRRHGAIKVAAIAGAALLAAIALLLAVTPHDVWAAAGSSAGSTIQGAKNFKKNGLSSVQSVGAVVFAVVAIVAIARATVGGKVGQGILGFTVACVGMAVSISPEATMSTLGQWATDLFKA